MHFKSKSLKRYDNLYQELLQHNQHNKTFFLKDHHVSITTRNMNEYSEHVNQQSK